MTANELFGKAVLATKALEGGKDYLDGIWKKISREGGSGSYLDLSAEEVAELFTSNDLPWHIEKVQKDKNGRRSAVLLLTGFPGFWGMIELDELPDDAKLLAAKYHGERVQVGYVSDMFAGTPVEEFRAICGIDDHGNGTFLVTAYPGPDVPAKEIEVPDQFEGQVLTVAEAKSLGATFAKVIRSATAVRILTGINPNAPVSEIRP